MKAETPMDLCCHTFIRLEDQRLFKTNLLSQDSQYSDKS